MNNKTCCFLLISILLLTIISFYDGKAEGKLDGCQVGLNSLYQRLGITDVDQESLTAFCKKVIEGDKK